uniref:Uncharacterized protein n=1 Tax=Eutreptiella gymnastica TaxID=73025 RepID=A0A6T2K689_9EUGL
MAARTCHGPARLGPTQSTTNGRSSTRFWGPLVVVLKHAAACRGTKNFALFIVIDNCLSAPSAPSALFAWETFCLTHIPPVLYYLSCHERVNSTINYTTDDPDGESD